jgi:hypothetical protein
LNSFQLDFPVKPRGQLQKENDEKFIEMLKEQKRDGKVTDHGLYEMLQEYMIENEYLRWESQSGKSATIKRINLLN